MSAEERFFGLTDGAQEVHDRSDDPACAEPVALQRGGLAWVLAERGYIALSDGERLIAGTGLPSVGEWLVE